MGYMTDQRWFAVGHSNHDEDGFHNQTLVVLAVA
jgi:hypothetical protein